MQAIIKDLIDPSPGGAGDFYDIIAFQEMWSIATFDLFQKQLKIRYPYSHYYQSGLIGSGLAIFSEHPIVRIGFIGFTLNGHPVRFFEGDWLANKGVGHARIRHPQGLIDVFTTHLVADYDTWHSNRRNCIHRLTQLHEMMQFVEGNTDIQGLGAIILGDLNEESDGLGWNAIINGSKFVSATDSIMDDKTCTCNCPDNFYTSSFQKPLRIDHILYRRQDFPGTVIGMIRFKNPSSQHHIKAYSDHYAVAASFPISESNPGIVIMRHDPPPTMFIKQALNAINSYLAGLVPRYNSLIKLLFVLFALHAIMMFFLIAPESEWNKHRHRLIKNILIMTLPLTFLLLFLHTSLTFLYYPMEIARLRGFMTKLTLIYSEPLE